MKCKFIVKQRLHCRSGLRDRGWKAIVILGNACKRVVSNFVGGGIILDDWTIVSAFTLPLMPTCVECGALVRNLYTQYSKDNIRLTSCASELPKVVANWWMLTRDNRISVTSLLTSTLSTTLSSYSLTCFSTSPRSIATCCSIGYLKLGIGSR